MRALRLILNLLIFLFLLIVAINNMDVVKLNFLGLYSIDMPLIIALVIFVFIGFIVGITLNLPTTFKLNHQISRLNKEIAALKSQQKEVTTPEVLA